ncbi:LLM class flavin-dependent oxidoreductase [Cryptosporangium sp. NPDC048952]|uniref:LLM class flavin-dependent oxidoreductase n=1 Tax=Cryptosporangium sp. NPDC048952 TaxID=3363961 RepID=UPI003717B22E
MTDRRFRFSVVAGQNMTGTDWIALARRAESLGYDVLLIPDTDHLGAPFPTAALAAGATTTLHVGTYVLVAPVRTAASIAHEASTMHRLTEGRFELGLGTGRPGAERLAEMFGTEFPPAAERIARVGAAVDAVRAQEHSPRILIAAGGPKILALAGRVADTVAFALPPSADEAAHARAAAVVRDAAGDRFDDIELASRLMVVGDRVVPGVQQWLGGTPAELAAAGSTAVLMGTPTEMAGKLSRFRDNTGVSYIAADVAAMEDLAPVVERLAGT